jgi:hypothetical protein
MKGRFLPGIVSRHIDRLVQKRYVWSIGMYAGDDPSVVADPAGSANPVLTHKSISDVPASFIADPFMVLNDGIFYMFFEVMDLIAKRGKIGLATSPDGCSWAYQGIVLDEAFHLSYPFVFKHKGDYYMIPETHETLSVRLYRAEQFPTKWKFVKDLLKGHDFSDPSLILLDGVWWLFVSVDSDRLFLFYSDDLEGQWIEHKRNPVVESSLCAARPGGRPVCYDGRVIRYGQDAVNGYGSSVRAFEILSMSPTEYEERELENSPVLKASGEGWNSHGMHTIDPMMLGQGRWIACVDGRRPATFATLAKRELRRLLYRAPMAGSEKHR